MKMCNEETGDILEIPAPDELGASVIRFNGRVVETCLYSDEGEGFITTADGAQFSCEEWPKYLIGMLKSGAWR